MSNGTTDPPQPEKPPDGETPKKEPVSCEYGVVYPREFDKCPVCGCPARFSKEAMKGDLADKDRKRVALGNIEFICDLDHQRIRLDVVVDSCVQCGVIYTLGRDRTVIPRSALQVARNIPPMPRYIRRHPNN